jgi:hypothetical protein
MPNRFPGSMITVAIAAAGVVISVPIALTQAQAPVATGQPLKTPWGEPDLQGIWTDEFDMPLERPAKYANQEFFTEAQREELDGQRGALLGRRANDRALAGGYNFAIFLSTKRTGARTSRIVDPPDGRIPSLTPGAQKAAAADREFRLALLQATDTCKKKSAGCSGGTYNPVPSPRLADPPPRYNAARMNRYDNPEDGGLPERCLTGGLPEFGAAFGGSFRRIVQTPGGITMFYDVGQGHAWQRNIVMNQTPHLPANISQWYGDSRGHWEGDTLVLDVTNFTPKTDYRGSRENLHMIERWTRTGPNSLEYLVTVADPTVWTKPWTVIQEFTRQSEQENRIYYEPRCHEGNYGLPGLLHGRRMEEVAFAQGRGPDPATKDAVGSLVDTAPVPPAQDPFQ